MIDRSRESMNRALQALGLMRQGRSLRSASQESGTTPQTVLRLVGSALRRTRAGWWRALPEDDFDRRLLFVFPDGVDFVAVRGSRRASAIGSYWNALRLYLEEGDDRELRRFAGKVVVGVDGRRYRFVTDPAAIRRLARAGQVSGFNSIY